MGYLWIWSQNDSPSGDSGAPGSASTAGVTEKNSYGFNSQTDQSLIRESNAEFVHLKFNTPLNSSQMSVFTFYSDSNGSFLHFNFVHIGVLAVFTWYEDAYVSLSAETKRKPPKYQSISCGKWSKKIFESPSVRLSSRKRGVAAPPEGHTRKWKFS